MKKQSQSGLTLIELIITMAIVGITLTFAIPNMNEFLKNEQLTAQNNALVASLQLARTEAISKHQQVVVCASDDGATCSSNSWADGWIVFRDTDSSGDVSDGETVIRARGPSEGNVTISNAGGSSVVYDRRGFSPDSEHTFSICDDRGAEKAKSLSISNTGRIRRGGNISC